MELDGTELHLASIEISRNQRPRTFLETNRYPDEPNMNVTNIPSNPVRSIVPSMRSSRLRAVPTSSERAPVVRELPRLAKSVRMRLREQSISGDSGATSIAPMP